jgi:hypothetical protein
VEQRRLMIHLRLLGIGLLVLAGSTAAARGELVIFSDGRAVKAVSHQAKGDQVEIRLPGGGSYSVDSARIERFVEDEVALSDMPPPRPVETAPIVRPPPRRVEAAPAPTFVPESAGSRQAEENRESKKEKGSRGGGKSGKHGRTGH